MRSLNPDEQALWSRVAATITPLSRDKSDPHTIVKLAKSPVRFRDAEPPAEDRSKGSRPIGETLDGGWDRRLRRGSVEPDRIIDLHGHSLDSAWATIDRGLERAISRGERLVVLITGHARAGDPPLARGRIRAAVDDWLASSRHAGAIASVRGAHPRHGGGGSLYVILRRC